MANEEHLNILRQSVAVWNQWREDNPYIRPDFSEANLMGANLYKANFHKANLCKTDLSKANLYKTDLTFAYLIHANLNEAYLREAYLTYANLSVANLNVADLREAKLIGADLTFANLSGTNLNGADLSSANLTFANLSGASLYGAIFVQTNFTRATLTNCRIYGISAWDLNLTDTIQKDLIITLPDQSVITVDDLEVAQFVYLLLHNEKIRQVIDTITSTTVLILGRFTPERKVVLDTIRAELRKHDFTPILFDFDKPTSRNLTETVSTLAHMARFVIADITDAKSIPQELQRIVPGLPSLPVQPIILASQYEYSMFIDLRDYPWVLPIHRYSDTDTLLSQLDTKVISPALTKAKETEERRRAFEEEMANEKKG